MDFGNLKSLIRIHSNIWRKPRNPFENGEDWFFNQICLENKISWESRLIWTKIVALSCDKLHKGYKNLYFGILIFIFTSPHEYSTHTKWRNWKRMKTLFVIHLPVKSVRSSNPSALLAHSWPTVEVECTIFVKFCLPDLPSDYFPCPNYQTDPGIP